MECRKRSREQEEEKKVEEEEPEEVFLVHAGGGVDVGVHLPHVIEVPGDNMSPYHNTCTQTC